MDETLGLLGHPGGILVDHPRLRVGVVSAVSRPGGLCLDLIGRSPYAADAVTGPPAPRVLLPRYDEGLYLRVAWLDADGRPHWEYGAYDVGTGPAFGGTVLRTRLRLPPMFDSVALVLAWPEIGFPEAVATLPLPGRDAVQRAATSIWTAPVRTDPPPENRTESAARPSPEVHPEAGLALLGPRVLHRGEDAVVLLTHLTLIGAALSVGITCTARGRRGGAATMASTYGPGRRSGSTGPRASAVGASVALVEGAAFRWLTPTDGSAAGGDDVFDGHGEYAFERPDGPVLTLGVGWPEAGLPDVLVRLPIER